MFKVIRFNHYSAIAVVAVFAAVSAIVNPVMSAEPVEFMATNSSFGQDDGPDTLKQHYVADRREVIKSTLKEIPLNLILPQYKNDKFCQDFREDFRKQRNVELVAPILRVHDYADPRLLHYFQRCPKFTKATSPFAIAPYVGPRDFVLYEVNIDNDSSNGKELVLLQEGFWKDEVSKLGYAVAHETRYSVIDVASCSVKGSFGGGPNPRFPSNVDVSRLNPEIGLHGIVQYRGQYYVYDVLPSTLAAPLSISRYSEDKMFSFGIRCIYDSRDPSAFAR